jgi:hypothetical protein
MQPWVQVDQPEAERIWERKLFYLLTPALMGDTRSGKIISEQRLTADKPAVRLDVPEFSRDVAVKLRRQP